MRISSRPNRCLPFPPHLRKAQGPRLGGELNYRSAANRQRRKTGYLKHGTIRYFRRGTEQCSKQWLAKSEHPKWAMPEYQNHLLEQFDHFVQPCHGVLLSWVPVPSKIRMLFMSNSPELSMAPLFRGPCQLLSDQHVELHCRRR